LRENMGSNLNTWSISVKCRPIATNRFGPADANARHRPCWKSAIEFQGKMMIIEIEPG